MPQYYPAGKVTRARFPEINRRETSAEYERALHEGSRAGLQRLDSRRRLPLAIL